MNLKTEPKPAKVTNRAEDVVGVVPQQRHNYSGTEVFSCMTGVALTIKASRPFSSYSYVARRI